MDSGSQFDQAHLQHEYEDFAQSGGTEPDWYHRYLAVAAFLDEVSNRVASRPAGGPLRPSDVPALPVLKVVEGDVESLLAMVWRSADNGIATIRQGLIWDSHWESIRRTTYDGMDFSTLTAQVIRDPEFENRDQRASAWLEAWRDENPEVKPRIPWAVLHRLIAGLAPRSVTSIADENYLRAFAKKLGVSTSGGTWYSINEAVLDRLGLPDDDPIMRNCYIWDLSVRLKAEAGESSSRSYWAIGASPDRYDIQRAIAESGQDTWKTGGSHVSPGDRVVFWKFQGADGNRGIVGLGEALSEPVEAPPSDSEFWIGEPPDSEPALRVQVQYEPLPSGPLWVQDEPFLGELSIAKSRGGTTFSITPAQWDQLMKIIGSPRDTARSVWWVNQRATFKEERAGGFLWAPRVDRRGIRPAHWANMARANAGDIVMSYAGGRIRAVSRVLAPAVAAKQPPELGERWNDDGELVRVEYIDTDPIELARIPLELRQAEGSGSPFGKGGGVNQGYLFPLTTGFLDRLAELFPTVESALGDLEGRTIRDRTWCVYVPRSGEGNFEFARAAKTWGAPQEGRLTAMRPGDRLLFAFDIASDQTPAPSGFPRVALDLFHGVASRLVEARATSAPFVDAHPIWPDDVYPERITFEELGEERDVPITSHDLPAAVVDAFRRSALAGGRPILAEGVTVAPSPFDLDTVEAAAVQKGLRVDSTTIAHIVAALDSGKHVILTGPPGTAKTTLAEIVASVATKAGRCTGHVLTTATADWTTYETIGGLRPNEKAELTFEQGHFLDAIDRNEWLVIDELNRSNFDRAFGQLFTVLSGQAVELPYRREQSAGRIVLAPDGASVPAGADVMEIPSTWRIIATMNVFDKSLLFEMSFALMRRFAFIEVPSPPLEVFHTLIDREAEGDAGAAALAKRFLDLRRRKDVGPAVFMDMTRFMRERRRVADVDDQQLAFEAFYSYLLPQFEGLDSVSGDRLYRAVKSLVGKPNHERLRVTLNSVLGLELRVETSAQEYAELDGTTLDAVEPADEQDELPADLP